MSCERFVDQMSAWIDGELLASESRELEHHLAECESCAELAKTLQGLHARTVELFEPVDDSVELVTERVMNQIPLQKLDTVPSQQRAAHGWLPWFLSVATAAILGFVLASIRDEPASAPVLPVGSEAIRFADFRVSTGPVAVAPGDDVDAFRTPDGTAIDVGTIMWTGPYKSELMTPSGAIIRLDSGTRVSVASANELVLEEGRLWCRSVGAGSPLAVTSRGTKVHVDNATCDIQSGDGGVELLSLDGDVQLQGQGWESKVASGRKVRFTRDGLVDEMGISNPLIETRWIHELLIRKHAADAELKERVEQLWASIGFSKVRYLFEEELRAMGPSCVLPLTSFLASHEDKHQNDHRRVHAATIVADVCDYSAVPRLIDLLDDRDPEVRRQMARGLSRVTGRSMSGDPQRWKTASQDQRTGWVEKWREWLEQSRRFPMDNGALKKRV